MPIAIRRQVDDAQIFPQIVHYLFHPRLLHFRRCQQVELPTYIRQITLPYYFLTIQFAIDHLGSASVADPIIHISFRCSSIRHADAAVIGNCT